MKTALTGTVVRFYVSRPGGRAIGTGRVVAEGKEFVTISSHTREDGFLLSVRRADLIGDRRKYLLTN